MKKNKHNYKLTDEQFKEAYRACEGNFSQTSKYIQDHFRIPYSKQAVQDRAENFPELVEKMYGALDNESVTSVMQFATDDTNDIKLRARLHVQVMNKIKHRERLKMQQARLLTKQSAPDRPEAVWEVGSYILHFPGKDKPLTAEQEQAWKDCMEEMKNGFHRNNSKLDAPPQNH